MEENVLLILTVYEGQRLPPKNGWSSLVTATLDKQTLATKPVALTSNPKFDMEMSWSIPLTTLRRLKQSRTPIRVKCLIEDNHGQQHVLGSIVLGLHAAVLDVQTEPGWHNLLGGSHIRGSKALPSLLLSVNLIRDTGTGSQLLEDAYPQEETHPRDVMQMEVDIAHSTPESPELHFLKSVNATQEVKFLSQRTVKSINTGMNQKRPYLSSLENDDVVLMETPGKVAPAGVNLTDSEEDQDTNHTSPKHVYKYNLRRRTAAHSSATAQHTDLPLGMQQLNHSIKRSSATLPLSNSPKRGASQPFQSQRERSLQQSSSNSSSCIRENGHGGSEPQPSSSRSHDVVALPGTSRTTDPCQVIPLLNAQGSYFQIGPAGEPDEQMFKFTVTIVFAKSLDQVVPKDMKISEADNPKFCYSLLGYVVYGDPIKDLAKPEFQAEIAAGRVSSTAHNVSHYFTQHPDLPINLTVGDVCLATANIKLSQFASSVLNGELPVQVEGSYPMVPNLFSPLGWKPAKEPVVGIIVNLSILPQQETPVMHFPPGVRDVLSTDKGFTPVLEYYSSASSNRSLSDSQEDSSLEWPHQNDGGPGQAGSAGVVARIGHKRRERGRGWHQRRKRQLYMASLELEKWKDTEQESFKKQCMERVAELQQHLAEEWESHVSATEAQLQQRLEQCQHLHQRLTDSLQAMETREREVALREEAIKLQKADLKVRKSEVKKLMKEARQLSSEEEKAEESKKIIKLRQQLSYEKRQRRMLQREVRELEAANKAKTSTLDATKLGDQVNKEEIARLKREKEHLQEELSVARQRKEYYKLQWVKTASQLHQAHSDTLQQTNSYRMEKPAPKQYYVQSPPKKSLQYKVDDRNGSGQLRSLPERAAVAAAAAAAGGRERKDNTPEKTTDPKKLVEDLIRERKGLREMVAKRRRLEEEEEKDDDLMEVPPSPSDVRKMMRSLVDR